MSKLWDSIRCGLFSIRGIDKWHREWSICFLRFKQRRKVSDAADQRFQQYLEHLQIRKGKILFRSEMPGYGGDAKSITEEILRRNLPWKLVWVVRKQAWDSLDEFPKEVRLVGMDDVDELLSEYASSQVWIDEVQRELPLSRGIRKKTDQLYVQILNGADGVGRWGFERKDVKENKWRRMREDLDQVDCFISHSVPESNMYRRLFGHAYVGEFGRPRNDLFFRKDAVSVRHKVYEKLGIPDNSKLLLYDPEPREVKTPVRLSIELVKEALEKRFGGKWEIAVKKHTKRGASQFYMGRQNHEFIDVATYADRAELLMAADAMISDYSAGLLDYLHTGRPAFVYAPDYVEYKKKRGLNWSLEDMPFPAASDTGMLIQNIENFDEKAFHKRAATFLAENGRVDDGRAAKRTVDLIENILDGKEPRA